MTRILEAVGAVAGVVGWVALVGGAHEYARFEAAGVPNPVRVASDLPREQLIGQGLQALAIPLLLGGALSAFFYLRQAWVSEQLETIPEEEMPELRRRGRKRAMPGLLAALGFVGLAVAAGLLDWITVTLIAVAGFVGAIAFAIVAYMPTAGRAAAAAFVASLGVGGVAVTAFQVIESDTRLDRVVVDRTESRPTVSGFFLGRGGGDVQMAVVPDRENIARGDNGLSVLTIPGDQVESVVIGEPVDVGGGKVTGERASTPPVITQLSAPRAPTIVVAPHGDHDTQPPKDPPPPPATPAVTRLTPVVPAELRVRAARDGTFEVPLSAPTEPVEVVVKARAPLSKTEFGDLGRWSIRLAPGSRVRVPFRLRKRSARRLAERSRLLIRVAVRTEGEAGATYVVSRMVVRGGDRR